MKELVVVSFNCLIKRLISLQLKRTLLVKLTLFCLFDLGELFESALLWSTEFEQLLFRSRPKLFSTFVSEADDVTVLDTTLVSFDACITFEISSSSFIDEIVILGKKSD